MQIENALQESRHYKDKSNQEIVHFPVVFRQKDISPQSNDDILNAPIVSFRIITKILSDISFNQFQKKPKPGMSSKVKKKNLEQLDLFEQDMLSVNNSYARFTFQISDVTNDTKNYRLLRKGLDFLKNLDNDWKKVKNKNGDWVHSEGGFIVLPTVAKGKVSFLMSSYWLEKLSNLDGGYNKMLYDISFRFKNTKHYLIFLWSLEIKEGGTQINYKKWQEVYQYNYSSATELCRNVFKPIKLIADKYSFKSFNFSVDGDHINFKPYLTKNIDVEIEKEVLTKHQITQQLSYWRRRHQFSKDYYIKMKILIEKDKTVFKTFKDAFTLLKKEYRKDKKSITNLLGEEFINEFQDKVIEAYNSSVWGNVVKGAYPNFKN